MLQNVLMQNQKKQKNLLIPIIICTIASSFYVYDYILRVMPEAMTQQLMRDFHIHAAGLGILASLFFGDTRPCKFLAECSMTGLARVKF